MESKQPNIMDKIAKAEPQWLRQEVKELMREVDMAEGRIKQLTAYTQGLEQRNKQLSQQLDMQRTVDNRVFERRWDRNALLLKSQFCRTVAWGCTGLLGGTYIGTLFIDSDSTTSALMLALLIMGILTAMASHGYSNSAMVKTDV